MNILLNENSIIDGKYLEELFIDLQVKDHVDRTLETMRKFINTSFKLNCISVILGEKGNRLYGMCVYPSENSLYKLSELILKETDSKKITKAIANSKIEFVVEIDPNLLYNPMYKFKPDELVAMLLHEIGHVVSDSDFYNDLAFAYRNAVYNLEQNKANVKIEASSKDIYITMIFVLSAITNTQFSKMPRNAEESIIKEEIADKFVVDNGYGKSLVSALDKFSKVYLNNYKRYSRAEYERAIQEEANNIAFLNKTFTVRKAYVNSLIDQEVKLSKSSILKRTLDTINKKLKTSIFRECVIREDVDEILDEAFLDKFFKRPLKISQCDIDELKISAEMMEDWDDKSILVYKIHKRLGQLAKAKEKVSNDKEMLALIDGYKKQLDELLAQVMKFKVVEKHYGVFIKYPKGYEG